ncbi:MAG: CoA-binding protein [Ignavibacteria bacterium]|nr:CoA-binding protein [Ignavibacteria bacterium]
MKKNIAEIEAFMQLKSFALIGASAKNSKKFGNFILKKMLGNGRTVYPIHRTAKAIDGIKCYPDIKSLPANPYGVVVAVPPRETVKVVAELYEAGIKNVWLQMGAENDKSIAYCITKGMNVIAGQCIIMFLESPGFPHNLHKWVWGIGAGR